jgi:hypothetical protein
MTDEVTDLKGEGWSAEKRYGVPGHPAGQILPPPWAQADTTLHKVSAF